MSKVMNIGGRSSLALAVALASGVLMAPAPAQADEFSGTIGLYSKYVLRGITNASEAPDGAIQASLDYAFDNGFYVGWWGSNLGYTYDRNAGVTSDRGFENDFYAGYVATFGDFSVDVGIIQYVYIDVDDSDLTEFKLKGSYGPFYLGMQYLLNDGWWGNAGDIYWTAGASVELPKGFTLSGDLGFYTYDDDDNSKLCFPAAAGCGATTESGGFRHFNITLSHPIGDTGADMAVTYIIGGENRGGVDQENTVVLSLVYGFDI